MRLTAQSLKRSDAAEAPVSSGLLMNIKRQGGSAPPIKERKLKLDLRKTLVRQNENKNTVEKVKTLPII